MKRLKLEKARELCHRCLLQQGASDLQARPITDLLIAAERDGCTSHGLYRLPAFVR